MEREDDATLVLSIDSVRRHDEGQYSCESDFDGQLATEHAQLIIYGQITRTQAPTNHHTGAIHWSPEDSRESPLSGNKTAMRAKMHEI